MNEENQNLDNQQVAAKTSTQKYKNWPMFFAVMFGFWIIALSILGAGYMVSRQISQNNQKEKIDQLATGANANPSAATLESTLGTADNPAKIEVPAGVSVLGNNNAKVTIIQFADFQCPYCGQWHKEIFPQIKKDFLDTNKARFVHMDLAFLGAESFRAAEATRCAADQNKFWEYYDALYTNQKGENESAFSDTNLNALASKLNLNSAEFNSCLTSNKYSENVKTDSNKSQSYQVSSTPTIFVNGIKMEGVMSYENYKLVIENELSK